MVTTRRAGAATTANSTEDRFVFADFKLIGALAASAGHEAPLPGSVRNTRSQRLAALRRPALSASIAT